MNNARNAHLWFLDRRCVFFYAVDMWIRYNKNPAKRNVGDCAVRAVSVALGLTWKKAYELIVKKGYEMGDMPSSDAVWSAVLRDHGFFRKTIPNYCPDCFTAEDFCLSHPYGIYVLGFGGHVATVVNGDLYDAWDSSNEIPIFYLHNREE